MRRLLSFAAAMVAAVSTLAAQGLSGFVLDDETRRPVPYAFVVILETGEAAESGEDGGFAFPVAPEPPFTLRLAADGYEAPDRPFEAAPASPLTLLASRSVVEMAAIEAVAERPAIETTKTVEKAEIRETATGGNPFAIVDKAPDTVAIDMPALENDIAAVKSEVAQALGMPFLNMLSTYSFRGLPYYSNTYFLNERIPLAFQNYGLDLNMLGSVFPSDVLSGMDMYGAGRNPALGPGAGLIASAGTDGENPDKAETIVSGSLLAAGVVHRRSLADGSGGLVLSLRKSLYELTWIPLIVSLNRYYKWFEFLGAGDSIDLGLAILPGNVDALASFWLEPAAGQRVSVDFFTAAGYTDIRYQTYSKSFGFLDFERLDLSSESGVDAAWRLSPREDLSVELFAYDLLAWNMNEQRLGLMGGEESKSTFHYPLNDAGGGLALAGAPWKGTALSAGATGRWIYGWYEKVINNDPLVGVLYKESSTAAPFSTWELASWAEATVELGRLELVPSVRLDWMAMTGRLYPSPMLQAYWYPAPGHSAHAGGGMRYDRVDYIVRHMFASNRDLSIIDGLDGDGNVVPAERIDGRYVQDGPARLFTLESDYLYEEAGLSLRAVAYGAYMDSMSGFNLDTYYSAGFAGLIMGSDDDVDTAGLKASDALWTAGGNLELGLERDKARLDVLYNLQVCRYHADLQGEGDYTWIVPKSDVTHQVKLFGHVEPSRNFIVGATLKTLLGIPATPNKVIEVYTSPDGPALEYVSSVPVDTERYQLRDYMPRFNLDFKLTYRWAMGKGTCEAFLDVVNLISFPHYRQPALRTIGAVERSALDREYDWSPVWMMGFPSMRVDAGFKIRF